MAAGCDSRSGRGVHPPAATRRTAARLGARASFGAAVAVSALGLWGSGVAFAAQPPQSIFNASALLPGGGTVPGIAVNPDASSVVISSAGGGCVVASLGHDGAKTKLLGHTAGDGACALAAGPVAGGGTELAYSAIKGDGTVGGSSTNGGASFTTSDTSGPIAMGSMVADPLVNQDGVSTLFLLVRDPGTGLPRVAVSIDGGRTYSLGSFLADPTVLASGLKEGTGASIAAGNLVARRDDTGLRLYVAFADPLGGVSLAIGSVAPAAAAGSAPAVTWTDHPVIAAPSATSATSAASSTPTASAAPATAATPKAPAAPSVAVDTAGAVYVAFSDTKHVHVAADADGTHWNPATTATSVDTVATGLPQALNASLQPVLVAGGNGMVDLAWLGASGGTATHSDPSSDPANTWNAYMAQTLDGGATWTAYTVSDHAVHSGALAATSTAQYTLAAGLSQVSGALVVAYAADQAGAPVPSLFATRQCTGISAVTGNSLVDECVAPQPATPVLPGSTCPGPQVNDAPGDALDTSAAGSGSNVPSLDITHVQLFTGDAADEQLTMTVNSLSATLPPDISQAIWRVAFTQGGSLYYAQAVQNAGGAMSFMDGALNKDGTPGKSYAIQGLAIPGNSGQITFTIPYGTIGSPATGAAISGLYGATYVVFTSGSGSLSAGPQLIDRAPDSGFGAAYALGQLCAPTADMPEVPAAALLPAVGGGGLFLWTFIRRKRSRRLHNVSASAEDSRTGEGESNS